jgi:curli biogenesis system outer membrane secretion channel CsgG
MSRWSFVAAALSLSLLAGGCVHAPAPAYQPGIANTLALRGNAETKMAVGEFAAAPGAENTRLGMRGNSMSGAGVDGRFSTYLQQALTVELQNAGRFDPASRVRVSGLLVNNQLDASGASRGSCLIEARFTVEKDGKPGFSKAYRASHQWESSFMGAIAIPAAMENYVATVQLLLGQLLADPEFIAAAQ